MNGGTVELGGGTVERWNGGTVERWNGGTVERPLRRLGSNGHKARTRKHLRSFVSGSDV